MEKCWKKLENTIWRRRRVVRTQLQLQPRLVRVVKQLVVTVSVLIPTSGGIYRELSRGPISWRMQDCNCTRTTNVWIWRTSIRIRGCWREYSKIRDLLKPRNFDRWIFRIFTNLVIKLINKKAFLIIIFIYSILVNLILGPNGLFQQYVHGVFLGLFH